MPTVLGWGPTITRRQAFFGPRASPMDESIVRASPSSVSIFTSFNFLHPTGLGLLDVDRELQITVRSGMPCS